MENEMCHPEPEHNANVYNVYVLILLVLGYY